MHRTPGKRGRHPEAEANVGLKLSGKPTERGNVDLRGLYLTWLSPKEKVSREKRWKPESEP